MAATTSNAFTTTKARQVIGPLTTVFNAPQDCHECTLESQGDHGGPSWFEGCNIFNTETFCGEPPLCFPRVTSYSDIEGGYFFYSPGLACPDKWQTVATVKAEDASLGSLVSGIRVDTLMKGETAAVCCPKSFTYVPDNTTTASCIRHVTTNPFFYSSCGQGNTQTFIQQTRIGSPTVVSTLSASGSTTWMITNTMVFAGVEMSAPTIQLNFRSQDLSLSSTSSQTSSAADPNSSSTDQSSSGDSQKSSTLSGGAIAGIVVGIVGALAIGLAIFLLMRRRKKRQTLSNQDPDPAQGKDNAYHKPELSGVPATTEPVRYGELPASEEPRFELDAHERPVEAPVHELPLEADAGVTNK